MMRLAIVQMQKLVSGIFKATEQAIAIGDPTTAANKAAVDSAGRLSTKASEVLATAGTGIQKTVGASAVSLVTADATRIGLAIHNSSNRDIYLGFTSGVTVAGGFLLPIDQTYFFDGSHGSALAWWAIADGGGADVRIVEFR